MLEESTIIRILLRDRIKILSYIDSFLDDRQLAEDCFQDVCAAAVAKGAELKDEEHVLRWALRVGRNKSVDIARKRCRQPILLDDDVLQALETRLITENAPTSEYQAQRMDALQHCLDSLTDNSRRIVDLRYVDGMKTGRIAELLGRKVESVYRALTRAHVALRVCMEQNLPQNKS